jgi:hypothetical protein
VEHVGRNKNPTGGKNHLCLAIMIVIDIPTALTLEIKHINEFMSYIHYKPMFRYNTIINSYSEHVSFIYFLDVNNCHNFTIY